jgi:hypothetical protein
MDSLVDQMRFPEKRHVLLFFFIGTGLGSLFPIELAEIELFFIQARPSGQYRTWWS